MLLALLALASAKLQDFYVPSIPGASLSTEMYAGSLQVPVHERTEPMFFWFFESKFRTTHSKTIIWFNGGPGCSSLDGALLEIGPIRFANQNDIHYNEGNWGEFVNILYIDQPFGTGYSFVEDPGDFSQDVEEAARNVDSFLQKWLEEFPHHLHDDFYLGGESYAGQYVPYIHQALTQVEAKGIVLLNPWLDSAHQYLSYAAFVKEHNIIPESRYAQLDELHENCAKSLQKHTVIPSSDGACNQIEHYVLEHSAGDDRCINVYNYELDDAYPSCGMNWPEGVHDMAQYLNKPEVLDALHVHPQNAQKWTECSKQVSSRFKNTNKPSAHTLLPKILEEIPVLIMVGDLDFICNIKGLESMAESLEWQGARGLGASSNITWQGNTVGSMRSARGLSMARITGGSHMIPVDKQFETRAVLHNFLNITDTIDQYPSLPGASSDAGDAEPADEHESSEVEQARKSAYKRAGFLALVVVVLLLGGAVLWLIKQGDVHISWSSITSGFTRALLHVGAPKFKRPFEYVNLDTFRPSGRPSTIVEEDEEDEYDV